MQTAEKPKPDAAGAAQPPAEKPPVAAAMAEPAKTTICPETGRTCEEVPQCVLPAWSDKCYCARWAKRICAEELKRREGNAEARNP